MDDRFSVDGIEIDAALRNPIIDQMAQHRSVRSFDPNRLLPEGTLTALVTAAQSAPSSSNFQTWSVVAVEDPDRKHIMREFCANQAFIDDARLFLAFCADTSRVRWVTERQGYQFNCNYLELLLLSVIDAALACQNAGLAAESLGLGCCCVGAIRNKHREVAEFLELPQGSFATVGLAIGYPVQQNKVKPRLPQPVILHRERYSAEGLEKHVDAYDKRIDETGIYWDRRVVIPGVTPDPDDGFYGWSEHTARRMARGETHRKTLAAFLRERGFSTD